MKKLFILAVSLILASNALASDIESLAKDGYGVVVKTKILNQNFDGCDYDKTYEFVNGLIFQCTSYKYKYSYNPDVYIMKHVSYDTYKVVIAGSEFKGKLYK